MPPAVWESELSEVILLDEKKLATIRLGVLPKTLEAALKVAEDLRKCYDLLFLHLETSVPARLTSVARWGISALKIPTHTWKAPLPTSLIQEYLAENIDANSGSSSKLQTETRDWKLMVDGFISRCDELEKERHLPKPPPAGSRAQKHSRPSSIGSSISEGHVSPEDDGPSRKVVRYDDQMEIG